MYGCDHRSERRPEKERHRRYVICHVQEEEEHLGFSGFDYELLRERRHVTGDLEQAGQDRTEREDFESRVRTGRYEDDRHRHRCRMAKEVLLGSYYRIGDGGFHGYADPRENDNRWGLNDETLVYSR